jgi:hypothetical protein
MRDIQYLIARFNAKAPQPGVAPDTRWNGNYGANGRRWTNYWVKGWYYDALYPAFYIRDYYKMDDCWFDMTGPTTAISDGITNMRDIQYLIARFNAKAPQPGVAPDTRWNGNYGSNGGVDPSGDRLCNMRDIQGAILHFNHKVNTAEP